MGRPKGCKTKPKPKEDPFLDDRKRYYCHRCSQSFDIQSGSFPMGKSPLHKHNNGYLPICNRCLGELYEYYRQKLGTPEQAVRRICMKFDIYYNVNIFDMAVAGDLNKNIMKSYITKANLVQFKGKTYDDTIEDDERGTIVDMEQAESLQKSGMIKVSDEALRRWGTGYSAEEYKIAEDHYNQIKKSNDHIDGIQENFIKDLANIKVLQTRAFVEGDASKYEKYSKLYQSTVKTSKLQIKSAEEIINDDNVTWGTWVADIEHFCPAEIYKDKRIFDDVDGFKDYFERFIVRPFKNFFTGGNTPDSEYDIGSGDTNDSN